MKEYYDTLQYYIESENKEQSVLYAIKLLNDEKINIVSLYQDYLSPILNTMACTLQDEHICVWKEHVRTAIVRTIVECCYPYVIKERDKLNMKRSSKAIVICPPEEYHDLGAKMVADFFTICGFDATFVGSNTPYSDFVNAVGIIEPDILAISISNYYNLIITKKIINEIRNVMNKPIKILAGGYAVNNNQENALKIGADYLANSFNDILNIIGNGELK